LWSLPCMLHAFPSSPWLNHANYIWGAPKLLCVWCKCCDSFTQVFDKCFCLYRYEKYSQEGNTCYAVAGYATVYEYYAYPDNTRPRISQMLVLPPFQRIGLGAQLLDNIYRHYASQPRVVDITGLPYISLHAVKHPVLLCSYRRTTFFFQITFIGRGCILRCCQYLELYSVKW
jgi:GNAT superfamily N-acetyltransferase